MAGRAVGAGGLVTHLGQVQGIGADLDVIDHIGAEPRFAAEQLGVGEVLGHEAQRDEDQQDVQVKTPLQP
ncbi:hypothetical protein D3C75_1110610 [compost metagenome]